jgi:tetratricopeptide (TPR) repeat protein
MRKWISILAVAALAFLGAGCKKLQSRDQLNKGVQAFKNAQYPQAVEHFKTAVELDPSFSTARLYLATAYMQQWIPDAVSPENKQMADAAYAQFQLVLQSDKGNPVALASIASLYLNQKDWNNAREWYEKLIAADPRNADAYYSLGFIAWSDWYPVYQGARGKAGMKQEDPGPIKDKKIKEDLKARYGQVLDKGLQNLDKAIEINPDYNDAMAYENLLIRERADLCDSKAEYDHEIQKADDWINRALEANKRKAEKKAQGSGGIHTETPDQK